VLLEAGVAFGYGGAASASDAALFNFSPEHRRCLVFTNASSGEGA
jgi:hypothetical protein